MDKIDIEGIKGVEKTNKENIFVVTGGNEKKALCKCVIEDGEIKEASFLCDFLYDGIELWFQYNNLAKVYMGGMFKKMYGLINQEGKEVVSCKYYHLSHFDENTGLACASENDEEFGFINRLGKVVIPMVYMNPLWYESDQKGLFWLKTAKGKWGALDERGQERIPFVYDDTNRIFNGSACVAKNGRFGFIDENGKILIDFKFKYKDRAYLTHFESYCGDMYAIITVSFNPIIQYYIDIKGNRISKFYNGIYKYVENEQGDRFAQRFGAIYLLDRYGNEQFVRFGSL